MNFDLQLISTIGIGGLIAWKAVNYFIYSKKNKEKRDESRTDLLIDNLIKSQDKTITKIGEMANDFKNSIGNMTGQFSKDLKLISDNYQQSAKERSEQMNNIAVKLNSIEYCVTEIKSIQYPMSIKIQEIHNKTVNTN